MEKRLIAKALSVELHVVLESELSMDRNRNLFPQEYINFLGTGAGMERFCGLPEQEQEFRLTVLKMLQNSCLDCLFQFSS